MNTLENKIYNISINLGRPLEKKEFCNFDLPSYNTCLRRGINLKNIQDKVKKDLYESNPKKCKYCNNKIPFNKKENDFCDSSCFAKYTNPKRAKNEKEKICKNCYKKLYTGKQFCSKICFNEYKTNKNINDWLNGKIKGYTGKCQQTKNFVRKYIFDTRGTSCSKCGWDEKHPIDGRPLTQIDHIDGVAENTTPENLRVLCPNCHSMTINYGARNKNSTRER